MTVQESKWKHQGLQEGWSLMGSSIRVARELQPAGWSMLQWRGSSALKQINNWKGHYDYHDILFIAGLPSIIRRYFS